MHFGPRDRTTDRAERVTFALWLMLLGLAALGDSAARARAQTQVEFVKRPYLMDARPTEIAILFELSTAAPATVTVRHQDAVVTHQSPEGTFHEVVVDALTPSGHFTYRVEAGGAEAEGSFTTAPPPGEGPVRFLVVGDNRTHAEAHAALIDTMLTHPGEFVVNTGDMVANGANQDDWRKYFEVEAPLLAETPLFPAMGNHEIYRLGVGLTSYLKYTRVPDTLGGAETYYGFDWGPLRFLMLDSNDDWSDTASAQRRWLEEQLEAAEEAPHVAHVIVGLHHGPVSSNAHGPHQEMVGTGVINLLRRHGVALVLSGHDHAYERGDAHGLKYIVTGGGGAPLYNQNDPLPFQHHFEATHHFLAIEATASRIDVTARRTDDSIIERCGFDRGGRWECMRDGDAASGFVESTPVAPDADPNRSGDRRSRVGPMLLGAVVAGGLIVAWLIYRRRRHRGGDRS